MISELKLLSPNLQCLSRGMRLISFGPVFPERETNTYMCTCALKLVWACFPSRKWQPCKTCAPGYTTASLRISSLLPIARAEYVWNELFVWNRIKERYTVRDKDRRESGVTVVSMQRWTEAALIWFSCCTATNSCAHTCAHTNTTNLYMFMTHCVFAGNKAGWHPAEWSQPMLSPTNQSAPALLINNIIVVSSSQNIEVLVSGGRERPINLRRKCNHEPKWISFQ